MTHVEVALPGDQVGGQQGALQGVGGAAAPVHHLVGQTLKLSTSVGACQQWTPAVGGEAPLAGVSESVSKSRGVWYKAKALARHFV